MPPFMARRQLKLPKSLREDINVSVQTFLTVIRRTNKMADGVDYQGHSFTAITMNFHVHELLDDYEPLQSRERTEKKQEERNERSIRHFLSGLTSPGFLHVH
jgi:hypothetical protein